MAKRHVNEYFNKIAEQYSEMLENIREFEQECSTTMVEPEIFDNMKKTLEPIKNNYMTWSYMMYLLNLPNRDSKVKTVKRREKTCKVNKAEQQILENNEVLNKLKNHKN